MNEAQRKVRVRAAFTVSTLCLLLAGWAIASSAEGVFLRWLSVGAAALAVGIYFLGGTREE